MEALSLRQYGKRIGKSHETVRKWIAAGMPTISGKIEPVAADAWRAANLETPELPLEAPAVDVIETPQKKAPDSQPQPPAISGLTAARTEREQIKVQREALKLGAEKDELVPVSETEQAWSEMVTSAKDRLMILPGMLAPRLAPVSDELQIHSILEREIMRALAELSRGEVAA